MKSDNDFKIPLIISVAGHIDIATPESVLQEYFADFWRQLRAKLGESTPFILLSSIAAGADHLAVKYLPADVQYCAVLPFAQERYEQDFSGAALKDFRADLQGAFKCIICDGSQGDYTKAADYIRTHADIIVTLWDGKEALDEKGNISKGGTYYTITKALGLDKFLTSKTEKPHLLVNIPVVRKKLSKDNEKKIFDNSTWGTLCLDESSQTIQFSPGISFRKDSAIYNNIENIRKHNNSQFDLTGERNYLYHDFTNKFPQQFKIIEKAFLRYEYFDKVATENQAQHKREFLWLAIISFVAGLFGQVWGDATFSSNQTVHEWIVHGVILFYFIFCIAAFRYYQNIKTKAHYEKYIHPRVLAELMRLNIFWKLSAIKEEFFEYLLADSGNYWCALPICNWEIAEQPLSDADKKLLNEEFQKNFLAVRQLWINDQKNFYKSYVLSDPHSFFKIQSDEQLPPCKNLKGFINFIKIYFRPYQRIDGYVSCIKAVFFWGGFGLATLLLVVFLLAKLEVFTCLTNHVDFLYLGYYREVMIGLCPFGVATLGWLLEKKQWNMIGKRYKELYNIFAKAEKQLDVIKKPEMKQELIKELAFLCHQENSEWVSIKEGTNPEPMF